MVLHMRSDFYIALIQHCRNPFNTIDMACVHPAPSQSTEILISFIPPPRFAPVSPGIFQHKKRSLCFNQMSSQAAAEAERQRNEQKHRFEEETAKLIQASREEKVTAVEEAAVARAETSRVHKEHERMLKVFKRTMMFALQHVEDALVLALPGICDASDQRFSREWKEMDVSLQHTLSPDCRRNLTEWREGFAALVDGGGTSASHGKNQLRREGFQRNFCADAGLSGTKLLLREGTDNEAQAESAGGRPGAFSFPQFFEAIDTGDEDGLGAAEVAAVAGSG